jgi:hypothetical protein
MKFQGYYLLVCGCLVISLFAVYANAQAAKEGRCTVEITEPKTGESVGAEALVSGVARIPAGTYLWVFTHRKGLAIWWPQGGGAAAIENGKWSVLVTFGGPQDRGAPFEVAALVVDHATHAKLEAWFKQAEESKSYPGMRLPVFVEGCEPPKITVTKAN